MTADPAFELLQAKDKELKQASAEIARLQRQIELVQFAFRDLLSFRCLDGVAQFDKSKNSGYSKHDEYAPFLTESFLYNSVGKETARSILGRVRTVIEMLGMSDTRFYSPALSEDEEVRLEMARDLKNPDMRRHFYSGRRDTPEEREAAKIAHEKSARESVRRSRSITDRFLKAIGRELDEDERKDKARRDRAEQRIVRAKTREIEAKLKKPARKRT